MTAFVHYDPKSSSESGCETTTDNTKIIGDTNAAKTLIQMSEEPAEASVQNDQETSHSYLQYTLANGCRQLFSNNTKNIFQNQIT